MAVFPQEIINMIVKECQDPGTLWNLLTVSPACQRVVEERLWKKRSDIRITRDYHVDIIKRYTGHRSRFLRRITLEQDLRKLTRERDDPEISCRPTADEVRENDELFTNRIRAVFTAIKAWEIGLDDEAAVQRLNITLIIKGPHQLFDPWDGLVCFHRRYHSWRLHLLQPETLPTLQSVKKLAVDQDVHDDGPYYDTSLVRSRSYLHPVDLRLALDLLDKLPNCQTLAHIDIHDSPPWPHNEGRRPPVLSHLSRPYEGPRRDSRHDFARGVEERASFFSSTSPGTPLYPSLKSLTTHLGRNHIDHGELYTNQTLPLPDLVTPDPKPITAGDAVTSPPANSTDDPLSSSLRTLSQSLVTFEVRGCLGKSIFWPSSTTTSMTAQTPFWPHLTNLSVEFDSAHPRGTWFFQAPHPFSSPETEGVRITQDHYPPFLPNGRDKDWCDSYVIRGGLYERKSPDMFRIRPVDAAVNELLEAFARALERMPLIKKAEVYTLLYWCPRDFDMGLFFEDDHAPFDRSNEECCGSRVRKSAEKCHWWGVKYEDGDVRKGTKRRLEWKVGDWRPSEKVLDMVRRAVGGGIGGKGVELVEEWCKV